MSQECLIAHCFHCHYCNCEYCHCHYYPRNICTPIPRSVCHYCHCHYCTVTTVLSLLSLSLLYCHYCTVTIVLSLLYCHYCTVTTVLSLLYCHCPRNICTPTPQSVCQKVAVTDCSKEPQQQVRNIVINVAHTFSRTYVGPIVLLPVTVNISNSFETSEASLLLCFLHFSRTFYASDDIRFSTHCLNILVFCRSVSRCRGRNAVQCPARSARPSPPPGGIRPGRRSALWSRSRSALRSLWRPVKTCLKKSAAK